MSDNFQIALNLVLDHEGGYNDDEKDNGGETKWGISKRAYPDLDIKTLAKQDAAKIYRKDYWNKIRGDYLPHRVSVVLFDMAVNLGVSRAVKLLQKVCEVKQDGIFGPVTMQAALELHPCFVVERLTVERLKHYSECDDWEHFKGGWIRRSVETLSTSILCGQRV